MARRARHLAQRGQHGLGPRHRHRLGLRRVGASPLVHHRRLAALYARKVLGWPRIYKLAHAFLWEHIYKRPKLAQLLGQLGVFLTDRRRSVGGGGLRIELVLPARGPGLALAVQVHHLRAPPPAHEQGSGG